MVERDKGRGGCFVMTKREKIKIEFNLLLKLLKQQERDRNKYVKTYCKQMLKVVKNQWGTPLWELRDPDYVRHCIRDLRFVDSSEL